MKTTILLDADVPAYQFAARGQSEIDWDGDGDATVVPPPEEYAIDGMLEYINDIKQQLDADRVVLCFTDLDRRANWRLDVLPSYKAVRGDRKSRPLLHDMLEIVLAEHFEAYRRPRLEGDDILGILATNPNYIKGRKIIVTIDKDMRTIPSRKQRGSDNLLYHIPKKGKPKLERISEAQADWYWMYQTIIGDSTDGYKGCPGAGPVMAKKILGEFDEAFDPMCVAYWWPKVVELYESKGFTEDDALTQARVARICRHEDYDYRGKRVIPWSPNS